MKPCVWLSVQALDSRVLHICLSFCLSNVHLSVNWKPFILYLPTSADLIKTNWITYHKASKQLLLVDVTSSTTGLAYNFNSCRFLPLLISLLPLEYLLPPGRALHHFSMSISIWGEFRLNWIWDVLPLPSETLLILRFLNTRSRDMRLCLFPMAICYGIIKTPLNDFQPTKPTPDSSRTHSPW